MNMQITEKTENPLLDRLEVNFSVDYFQEATPSRDELRSELASQLDVEKERVIINYLHNEFGRSSGSGYAHVYDSLDSALRLEKDYLLERHGLKDKE